MNRITSATGFMLYKFSTFIGASEDNNNRKDDPLPIYTKKTRKASNESTYYHPINPFTKKLYELCAFSLHQTATTTARSQPSFNNNLGLIPLQKQLQKLDIKQRFLQKQHEEYRRKQRQVLQRKNHVKIYIEPDDYIIINMAALHQEKQKILTWSQQNVIAYDSPPTDEEEPKMEQQHINVEDSSSTLQQVIDNDDIVIEYNHDSYPQKVEEDDSGDDKKNAIQQVLHRNMAAKNSILAHLRSDNECTTTVVQLTSHHNSIGELTCQPSDDGGSSILSIPRPISECISRNNYNLQQPFQFGYQPQQAWQQQNANAQTYNKFGYSQQQQQQQQRQTNNIPTFNRFGFPQQQLQPQQQNTHMMTFNPFGSPEQQANTVQPVYNDPNFNLSRTLALLENKQNHQTPAVEVVYQQPQIPAHLLASVDDRPWRPIRVELKRHFSSGTTDRPASLSLIDKVIQFERRMREYEESLYQELFGGDSTGRTLYPSPPSSNDAHHQDFLNSQRREFIESLKMALPEGYIDGHYTEYVTSEGKYLGEGANGPVVIGSYINTPERGMIALKRCKVHLEGDFAQTIREIYIMGKEEFQHPNITRVQNVFFNEDFLYMTMDLMESSLFDLMSKIQSGIPEDCVVYVIYEVVKALNFLHNQAGFFHGDIKSENILLGRDGSVKLTDFGLSYPVGTINLRPSGTTYWMAPEVADHDRYFDEKSDVWSLGMTIIELLDCGLRRNSTQLSDEQELHRVAATVTPPTVKHSIVTPSMAYILRLLLKVNPEMRPTMTRVENELSTYIQHGHLPCKTKAEFAALMEQYL